MHAALGLPEIQRSICRFLAPFNAAALARTSQAFFHPAVEHLWGNNKISMEHLLVLLDGVTIERNVFVRIRLPDDFSETYWSRFSLYAPWVKYAVSMLSLDPDGRDQDLERITIIAKSRMLLPKLATLIVWGDEEDYHSISYIDLLEQLIPPTLRSLKIYNINNSNLQSSINLIRKAVTECPHLGLHWLTWPALPAIGPLPVPLYVEKYTIFHWDMSLDVLKWMAAMPRLKTLQLSRPHSPLNWLWGADIFPPNAFISLRSLTVTLLNMQAAARLWSSSLVSNLYFARILFSRFHADDVSDAFDFLTLLAKRSPNLTGLSLAFESCRFPSSNKWFPARLLLLLSPLSLDFLEVNGAQVQAEGVNVFSQIGQLWPSLRTLNLRNTSATLSDLTVISTSFPRLGQLSLTLVAEPPPSRDTSIPPVQHFSQPLTFQTPFLFLYKLSLSEQDDFALYLARLWKNVRCVHPRKGKEYGKFLYRLNARISKYSRQLVE
ncbi:hypothetical protein BDV93DRAFT_514913 [Ceratobasidium sp. AG-I]|nr:hypothetical protein BDV93DRAFT_514913 [Ceratobasidium sp. AG-I]